MGTSADLPARHRLALMAARILLTLRHPLLVARFARRMGYLPNPAAPTRYNELMLWRKITDHNPLFVKLTDKLAAKTYIRAACPELPVPETLWSGRNPEDIPAELLAGQIVVKTNHGCAMNIFVSGNRPERSEIVRKTKRWIRKRYGRRNGEWAYWSIDPTLFVEERLTLASTSIATDIKVHVCGGDISHVWAEDKLAGRSHLFDGDGRPLPGRDPDYPREDQSLPVSPALLDFVRQAIALAPRIAGDLDHARIDFLVTDRGLYAGEICIYSAAGYGTWSNPVIAERLERLWRLEESAYLRRRHRGVSHLYAEALHARCAARAAKDPKSKIKLAR
ncbi:ATP-grasp fold amidoligase family protein [Mesorhizobium australafricanum]|uniref:ATP-grasp fold amidoligase family protein n=1 Tax=Mesorhizobium australafricanum TaxID=3072311 RepID=A0ABU4X5B1_9HYPH|nr:ATP-grasp fold amidoligase family protein [Mesorhizobium sp. VK3E]MDX8443504.1 ATP-grasp fold amidoligase family protein [Mesorhizobium sp. VK3E]